MHNFHISLHGNYAIGFVIFYQTPMKNRSLCQINLKCLFRFANDALQHLWVFQIHMMIIIDSKKSPTYRGLTMKPHNNNLCFMVSSWRTFEFSTLLPVLNEDVAINVWTFSSILPITSVVQNSTSSAIEQTKCTMHLHTTKKTH